MSRPNDSYLDEGAVCSQCGGTLDYCEDSMDRGVNSQPHPVTGFYYTCEKCGERAVKYVKAEEIEFKNIEFTEVEETSAHDEIAELIVDKLRETASDIAAQTVAQGEQEIIVFSDNESIVEKLQMRTALYPVTIRRDQNPQRAGQVVLRSGGEELTSASVTSVQRYLSHGHECEAKEIFDNLRSASYVTTGSNKSELLQVSRDIEEVILQNESGRVHAGFQYLSRLFDSPKTLEVYKRIDELEDVELFIYGEDDVTEEEKNELKNANYRTNGLEEWWFVNYIPHAKVGAKMVLLCRDVGNDRYAGFWGHEPEVSMQLEEGLNKRTKEVMTHRNQVPNF